MKKAGSPNLYLSSILLLTGMLSWIAMGEDLVSRGSVDPSYSSLSDDLFHHDFLSTLRRPYMPCTAGTSLLSFMENESNGPFLRPLWQLWRSLDSPELQSVCTLQMAYLTEQDDKINLAILNLQQEFTVASFLRHTQQPSIAKEEHLPFSMFASQLLLFSHIKAELMMIKQQRNKDPSVLTLDTIWRSAIQKFAQSSSCVCRSAGSSQQRCLRGLIWGECDGLSASNPAPNITFALGEAADWPPLALEYAFVGFLAKKREEGRIKSSSTTSVSPTASVVDGVELASSLQSETLLSQLSMQPSPFSSPQNALSDHSKEAVGEASHVQSRRPTWTNFWTTDMIELFAADSQTQISTGAPDTYRHASSPPQFELADASSASNEPFEFHIIPQSDDINAEADHVRFWQQPLDGQFTLPQETTLKTVDQDAIQNTSRPSLRDRSRSISYTDNSRSRAACDRSQRHYLRTKAQRSVLTDLCTALQSLTRTFQSSHLLSSTVLAKLMISVMSKATAQERQASILMLRRSNSGDANQRKRESKTRMRKLDESNAAMINDFGAIITSLSYQKILECALYIKGASQSNTQKSEPEDLALEQLIKVWYDYEHGWPDLCAAIQRLIAPGAGDGLSTAQKAIRLLSLASNLQDSL